MPGVTPQQGEASQELVQGQEEALQGEEAQGAAEQLRGLGGDEEDGGREITGRLQFPPGEAGRGQQVVELPPREALGQLVRLGDVVWPAFYLAQQAQDGVEQELAGGVDGTACQLLGSVPSASRPPGRSTRRASASARRGSGR